MKALVDRRPIPIHPLPTPMVFTVGAVFLANGAAYEVVGVHLGGVRQTSTIAIKPLSEEPNCCAWVMHVPEHILESAFRADAVFLDDLIAEATLKFGSDKGLFNTACFQSVLGENYSSADIQQLLSCHKGVVRLHGGCHWLRLPDGLRRYDESLGV